MDRMHVAPSLEAIERGYDILLEKPIAPTREECIKITEAARKKNVKIIVCHVLRYTTYYRALKRIIDSNKLGDIISIDHNEDVGNTHQSHSFVRGNWANSNTSSVMILQKCCHDLDILQWLLNKEVKKIQSFGSLSYFTKKNAPKNSPLYCIDGCPEADKCPYNAVKLYLEDKENTWFRESSTCKVNPTDEDVLYILKNSDYGKCVFKCNNNVVDHQTVSMLFEDDITVTLNMNAFNKGGRRTVIYGTKGQLTTSLNSNIAEFYNFDTCENEQIDLKSICSDGTIVGGHGGGDTGIIDDLYDYVTGKINKEEISEIEISCKNHMMAFAAEEARVSGKVIDMDEYIK